MLRRRHFGVLLNLLFSLAYFLRPPPSAFWGGDEVAKSGVFFPLLLICAYLFDVLHGCLFPFTDTDVVQAALMGSSSCAGCLFVCMLCVYVRCLGEII